MWWGAKLSPCQPMNFYLSWDLDKVLLMQQKYHFLKLCHTFYVYYLLYRSFFFFFFWTDQNNVRKCYLIFQFICYLFYLGKGKSESLHHPEDKIMTAAYKNTEAFDKIGGTFFRWKYQLVDGRWRMVLFKQTSNYLRVFPCTAMQYI